MNHFLAHTTDANTEWAHLPNAVHIDRVLASVKANPDKWSAAYDAAWDDAYDDAYDDARSAAYDAAWSAARHAAWSAAYDAAKSAAWSAAWSAAALIAWDDSAKYLSMTPDEIRLWSALSDDPAALLLLPAVIVFESEAVLVDN